MRSGIYNANRRVQILRNLGFSSKTIKVYFPAAGKDVSDHIDAGLGPRKLRPMDPGKLENIAPKHAGPHLNGSDGVGVNEPETVKPADVRQASGARAVPDVLNSAEQCTIEDVFGDDEEEETVPGRPLLPPPAQPLDVAQETMRLVFTDGEGRRLLAHWRGGFYLWSAGQWDEILDRQMRVIMYDFLGSARTMAEKQQRVPWNPTTRRVSDVINALAAVCAIPDTVDDGTYINREAHRGAPLPTVGLTREFIPTASGLLDPISRNMKALDPGYFNLSAVPVYALQWQEARLGAPRSWLSFLRDLWPDDPASIRLLQEMFGYLLSGETRRQKAFLLVGPPRSGKGTIARILSMLMGKRNVAGPTLASIGQNFGLSSLIGKSLAVISDARFRGRDADQVIERLLSITGEDRIDIDRKHREIWTGQLGTRFLLISNELPYLADASGAIATRFAVLILRNSWLGHEDETLTDRLAAELPQILHWALDGLDRLQEQGRFTEPDGSREASEQLAELTSREAAFIKDFCVIDPTRETTTKVIFAAWKMWCQENGHQPGQVQQLGNRLDSAVSSLGGNLGRAKRGEHAKTRVYTGICINKEIYKTLAAAGEIVEEDA